MYKYAFEKLKSNYETFGLMIQLAKFFVKAGNQGDLTIAFW